MARSRADKQYLASLFRRREGVTTERAPSPSTTPSDEDRRRGETRRRLEDMAEAARLGVEPEDLT